MMRVRLALPALCASMLLGCSEAPVYEIPKVPAPSAYKEPTGIWQPAQPADSQPRGDWWKAYGDTQLNDLVERLDKANADLAAAMAHFDQATAFASQARAGYFPTISAGALVTHNRQSDTRPLRSATQPTYYGDHLLGLQASYEVDLWGRVRNAVDAGEAGAQAAASDLQSIHLSLRAELVNDYLSLRMLDAQSKLLTDEVESYTKALELTQRRFENGIDSALDMSRAKVQLDTAKAKLSDIAASRSLFEHAIATLVGEAASGFSIAPAVVDIQMPPVPVGVPSTLLQRRPDIAASERRLFAANASIGVAKTAFYPTVNLSAAGGYDTSLDSSWLTAPNIFWSIGPSVLMTIFDGGRRDAIVKQAEAAFKGAGAQYRSTVLHAFQEVEDNLSLLNNLTEESIALDDAVNDTGRTLDIAMHRYKEGVSSYLDVVTAQASAQQVQLDELNVRRRRLQASVNLIRALGGGLDGATGNETAKTSGSDAGTGSAGNETAKTPSSDASNGAAKTPGSDAGNGAAKTPGSDADNGAAKTPGSDAGNGMAKAPGSEADNGAAKAPGSDAGNGAAKTPSSEADNGAAKTPGSDAGNGTTKAPGSEADNGAAKTPGSDAAVASAK